MTSKCSLNFDSSLFCFRSIQININFLFLKSEYKNIITKRSQLQNFKSRRSLFDEDWALVQFLVRFMAICPSIAPMHDAKLIHGFISRLSLTWPGNSFASIGFGKCWSLGASLISWSFAKFFTENNNRQTFNTKWVQKICIFSLSFLIYLILKQWISKFCAEIFRKNFWKQPFSVS